MLWYNNGNDFFNEFSYMRYSIAKTVKNCAKRNQWQKKGLGDEAGM
jgi:hypothetical protein